MKWTRWSVSAMRSNPFFLIFEGQSTIMKRFLAIVAIAAAFTAPSCKEVAENDGKTVVLYDSIGKVLPTIQSLDIHVDDDRSNMKIVIGDVTFYNASAAEKAQKAKELGKMILRIYGPNNMLTKASLTVTKDVHNKDEAPKDGIVTPIDIEGLKK